MFKIRSFIWIVLAALMAVPLGVGCDDGPAITRRRRFKSGKKFNPKKRKKLSVKKQTIDFIYSPVGKRDPFRPYYFDLVDSSKGKSGRSIEDNTPVTPLEKYDLDQLKLIAIITGVAEPIAMMQAPGGMGYVVRRGTLIGKNKGRITRIGRNSVVIAEVYKDFTGKRIVNPIVKRIGGGTSGKMKGTFLINGRKVYLDRGGRLRVVRLGVADDRPRRRRKRGSKRVRRLKRKVKRSRSPR